MPCYHPMFAKAYINKYGRKAYAPVGSWFDYENLKYKYPDNKRINCGQCIGCRLESSRQWAIRCVLESRLYDSELNWFMTLTYDDFNLPFSFLSPDVDPDLSSNKVHKVPRPLVLDDTGEVLFYNSSLVPDDFTTFERDLRRYFEYHFNYTGIRFFGCGEYGSVAKTGRPHYHIIFFNLPLFLLGDLKPYRYQKKGQFPYFESEKLSKIWKKGLVCVGHMNFDAAAYTARYCLKKRIGQDSDDYYNSLGLVKEFTRMSRRPGIGRDFYEQHKDQIYDTDSCLISLDGKNGSLFVPRPPSYFDRLFDVEDPEAMSKIKDSRFISAVKAERFRKLRSSKSEELYLSQLEDSTIDDINKLTFNF